MRQIRTFGLGAAMACAVLALASALPAQTTREKHAERARAQSRFNLAAVEAFTYNVNNWLCGLDDGGRICINTFFSTTGGGGFWPIGTSNQYIFELGLQFAARDPLDPNRFVAAQCFNVSATQAQCTPVTGIFHADDPVDLANWPEACNIVNPQTGEFVKTLSQLDTCVKYWDGNPATTVPGGHPLGVEVTQHTLAFTIEGFRDMIFAIFKVKNVSHTPLFRQFNPIAPEGGWPLTEMYLAVGHDADVSSDEVDENFGTFVPFLVPPTPDNPTGVPLWLGTIWQADFVAGDFQPYPQCGFCSNPGFVGTTFLRSPYNNTGAPIFNAAGNREVPPIEQERLEQLLLAAAKGDQAAQEELKIHEIGQSFGSLTTRGGVFPDPADAAQSWRYYSGNLNPAEKAQVAGAPPGFGFVDQPATADARYFHATGPFNLAAGDSVDVIVGIVVGAPVLTVPGFTPGTLVPHGLPGDTARLIEKIMGRGNLAGKAYPSIFKQVLDARILFETNFLLPTPPPSPKVTAIAGDRQVSVAWSDDPVNAADPYFPVAQQRGIPGFRDFDFEGFRVYRRVRPNAAWELIAQFDSKNGLTDVITTTDSVLTADGTYLAVRQDTAHAGTDTGLQFAIIDRGGIFPDPSNGPGLINGLTYFYTVTAYDVNTPFAPGGSSLESGQRLTRNVQDIGGAAAIPRSTASGVTAAVIRPPELIGDDQVLSTEPAEIDKVAGTFSGPSGAAEGLQVTYTAYDPLLISPGEYSVTVDSVVPLNGFEDVLGVHFQEHPNCLGVSIAFFLTARTPGGSQQIRQEITDPVEYFCAAAGASVDLFSTPLKADATRAQQFGRTADHFASAFSARIQYNNVNNMSGAEPVNAFRVHFVGPEGGSRWFVDTEPGDPTLETAAGSLPGVTKIWNMSSMYVQNAAIRWLAAYLMTPLMRSADFEVTWGENGTIEKVVDLTHNLEVPFDDKYRASWGIRNEASGDGILSSGDFWYVSPTSEWYCEAEGCHVLLERQARIQPMSTRPPSGFGDNVATANAQGFGLHIAGELFLFETAQLPAPGTKWTLRSLHGVIALEDGTYSFTPSTSPPNIIGLTARVVVESPTDVNLAAAKLDKVHTVPDPYIVRSPLQSTSAERKILFVNLPPRATIRIFSLSGVLIDAIVHDDPSGGGSATWDLRNRNNQYVASGIYFYHVETPDGKEKVGKFTIVQAP